MNAIENELADLRRRILQLSRDDLVRLVEGVIADWRAERAEGERQTLEGLQWLLANEAKQKQALEERSVAEHAHDAR